MCVVAASWALSRGIHLYREVSLTPNTSPFSACEKRQVWRLQQLPQRETRGIKSQGCRGNHHRSNSEPEDQIGHLEQPRLAVRG